MSSENLGTRLEKRKARKLATSLESLENPTVIHQLSLRGGSPGEGSSLSSEQRRKLSAKCSPVFSRIWTFPMGLFIRELNKSSRSR